MAEEILSATDQRIADRNLYRSHLINLVRVNPILWDKKSPDFNQRLAKIKKWLEVAAQLGVSVDKIRRTWENLRDQYRRDLKRNITTGARSKWRFFNDMNFIRSMVRIKGSNHQHQSDSESDYEEYINDNYQDTLTAANMLPYSGQPTTAATATTSTANNANKPQEFLPIKLTTEWKQFAAREQIQQSGQQEQQELQPQIQQQHYAEQPQQDCDSSEEQKYDNEVYEAELPVDSNVIKIELDSDSNDESLSEILPQQQPQLQQQQQPESAREPRPSAPRPDISKQESEEFVTTSESVVKSRKRRLSTQTDANAEEHFQSCFRTSRQHGAAQDSELQDEDYHFVMSILPSLRQVARQRKFPLRSQIMSLISKELEEESND